MESLSDKTICAQYSYGDGVYKCPASTEVYQVVSQEGGLCQFDRVCSNDGANFQACGCSFVTVTEVRTALETTNSGSTKNHVFQEKDGLQLDSTVCEDKDGNIVAVWSDNFCDNMVLYIIYYIYVSDSSYRILA